MFALFIEFLPSVLSAFSWAGPHCMHVCLRPSLLPLLSLRRLLVLVLLSLNQVLLCKLIDVLDGAVPYELGPEFDLDEGEEPRYIIRDFRWDGMGWRSYLFTFFYFFVHDFPHHRITCVCEKTSNERCTFICPNSVASKSTSSVASKSTSSGSVLISLT